MGRAIAVVAALAAAGLLAWAVLNRNRPPEIPVVQARRGTLVSTLSTNGKVEPTDWATARAERPGAVQELRVERGRNVRQGDPLVELGADQARADLANAEARISQAKAELETVESGGRARDLAEIAGSLERARLDLAVAQKELAGLERLEAKNAATGQEVRAARERVDQAQLQIRNLQQRRESLSVAADKTIAQAKLLEAEAAARLAREQLQAAIVTAPVAGTVYQFDLKLGDYLNPGDLVAAIGRLERVRVRVFVDEPELGRVARGMPVIITWDARAGRQWKGEVEKTPTQIVALGSRQVGEVVVMIDNPGLELLPGTNVNAEIRSQVVEGAVTVPKEAVRRENNETGVYLLENDTLRWQPVVTGAASVTEYEIRSGLKEGDTVALPSEQTLKSGLRVQPVAR